MFESQYGKSLSEEEFEQWFENGRDHPIGNKYLLVTWNTLDQVFSPKYFTSREELRQFASVDNYQEELVAAYDLFSESRISI